MPRYRLDFATEWLDPLPSREVRWQTERALRSNRDDGRVRRYGEDTVKVRALESHFFAYHEYGFTFERPWCSTALS